MSGRGFQGLPWPKDHRVECLKHTVYPPSVQRMPVSMHLCAFKSAKSKTSRWKDDGTCCDVSLKSKGCLNFIDHFSESNSWDLHPPRGSNFLSFFLYIFLQHTMSHPPLCITSLYFPSFSVFSFPLTHCPPRSTACIPLSPFPLPFSSISLPLSDLILPLNLFPVKWSTRNVEVVHLWAVRSIKQGQAQRSTERQCILCLGWAPWAINPAIQAIYWATRVGHHHHRPRHLEGA